MTEIPRTVYEYANGSEITNGKMGSQKIYPFKPDKETKAGIIENRTQEKNGPKYNGKTEGYEPMNIRI